MESLHKAHLLRDLKDLSEFQPREQDWAQRMAGLLIGARDAARDARADGKKALDLDVLGDLVDRYRAIAASGLAGNSPGGPRPRTTPAGSPAGSSGTRT